MIFTLLDHLGHKDKADYGVDIGESDSSIEPVKKKRPPTVKQKGMTTFHFFMQYTTTNKYY